MNEEYHVCPNIHENEYGEKVVHAIVIHAKIVALALALMAFQANLTNEGRQLK